jgi:hypothetical protein
MRRPQFWKMIQGVQFVVIYINIKMSKELYEWQNPDVINWLQVIGFKSYMDNFRSQNITGYDLCFINSEDLKNELRITNLHERLAILKEIRKLILENCKDILI